MITGYFVVMVMWLLFTAMLWVLTYVFQDDGYRDWYARLFLLAPLWPLVAVAGAGWALYRIVRDAFGKGY